MLGNKLTKQKVCKYIRQSGLFKETYEDGWFFTDPNWMKDCDEYRDTIFRVKTKYLTVPLNYTMVV